MSGWLIDMQTVKPPADYGRIPRRLLDRWESIMGAITPGDGDFERFVEQSCRLDAAMRILPAPVVRVDGRLPDGVRYDVWTMPHYGPRPMRPRLDRLMMSSHADSYARFRELEPFYGRDTRLAACTNESVDNTVRDMLAAHPGEGCVVKLTYRPKYCPLAHVHPDGTFDHRDPMEPDSPMRRIPFDLWTWLGGAFGLEGEPDAILVQRKVRMRYEYRVHMVAGRAVCGAGCIERFTPLDNHGERFDPRMEETRGNGRIESHPFIAQLYADHAEQVHKAIAGHVTGHYTIDLYLGDDGRPHVLELNDGANSGLYALHMDPLLEAIRDNPRMFTPPRPAGRLSELMEVES